MHIQENLTYQSINYSNSSKLGLVLRLLNFLNQDQNRAGKTVNIGLAFHRCTCNSNLCVGLSGVSE